jgi:7-cyano-7-deazaguanine synthase
MRCGERHLDVGSTLHSARSRRETVFRAQEGREVLVLLSGGIDSAACLDFYLDLGRKPGALFVDYGQPAAEPELSAALAIADYYSVPLAYLRFEGASSKSVGLISGRNAFLVFTALLECPKSVSVIAAGIHTGTGYSDCSSGYVNRIQAVLDVYDESGVQFAAPFLDWHKAHLIEYCLMRGVPLELTYSCERGFPPCGKCLSCKDREVLDARA